MQYNERCFKCRTFPWLTTIFYMCKPTLVTTSRTNVICTCHCLYCIIFFPGLVNTTARLVNYKCKSSIKLTPGLQSAASCTGRKMDLHQFALSKYVAKMKKLRSKLNKEIQEFSFSFKKNENLK